jgi:hypothetical protein
MFSSGRFIRQEGCAELKGRAGLFRRGWRRSWLAGILCLGLFPQIAHAQGTITNLSVALTDNIAGHRAAYTLTLRPESGLANTDKIVITFPAGFDLSLVTVAGPQSGFTGGLTPSISGPDLTLTRDGQGPNVGDVSVEVSFALVTNHQTSGNYELAVKTLTSSNVVKDSDGGNGAVFTIVSDREPYGNIVLQSTTPKLPADGTATAQISTSQPIKDAQGNNVLSGKLLTIALNDPGLGQIIATDAAPSLPGSNCNHRPG